MIGQLHDFWRANSLFVAQVGSFARSGARVQMMPPALVLTPTVTLKWYPQGISLAERSCLTSLQPIRIRAGNAFSARIFPVWPAKRPILQRQFVIWPRLLIIICDHDFSKT